MDKLVIATTNQGKIREFKSAFLGLEFAPKEIYAIDEIFHSDFEVEETEDSFLGNARLKAIAGAKLTGEYCLADDSGIEIQALGGRPGIFSGRYLKQEDGGIHGVLAELNALGSLDRSCRFVCALVLASPSSEILFQTESYWYGQISDSPRGEYGFGYDPIVIPYPENAGSCQAWAKKYSPNLREKLSEQVLERILESIQGQTVAEIKAEIKNLISHRSQALLDLEKYFSAGL